MERSLCRVTDARTRADERSNCRRAGRAYDDPEQRQSLAASFVRGSIHNMRTNVTYYDSREYELGA